MASLHFVVTEILKVDTKASLFSEPGTRSRFLRIPFSEQCFRHVHLFLNEGCRFASLFVLPPTQLFQMRLIRPVCNPHGSKVCPHGCERRVLTYTLRTVCLHRFVYDFQRHIRDEDLCLCNLNECRFGIAGVNGRCSVQYDEARGVDIDARSSYPVQDDALFGEKFAEGLLMFGVGAGEEPAECFFGLRGISGIDARREV